MKWRPSQLGKLMTTSRNKNEILSQTAKSYINQVAKEHFFNYQTELNSKFIEKGKHQELESIELLNSVRFTDYRKNTNRVENDFMSGECDIIDTNKIIDVKTSWSLDTFPELPEDIESKDYEWQGRAYMWLYDKNEFEVVYCMVSTWEQFRSDWDDKKIHEVDHINPAKRITSVLFERDILIESQIKERLELCTEYYYERLFKLHNK